jgi:hypothetical protein
MVTIAINGSFSYKILVEKNYSTEKRDKCLVNMESHIEYTPLTSIPLFGKDASLIYVEFCPSSAVSWKHNRITPFRSNPMEML